MSLRNAQTAGLRAAAAICLAALSATQLSAQLQVFGDRTAFDAAAPGLPIEDFEEAPQGAGGFFAPLDSTSSNAAFSPGDILPGISFDASEGFSTGDLAILGTFAGVPSNVLVHWISGRTLIVDFTAPANAAGFDYLSPFRTLPNSSTDVTIEVFYGSTSLFTQTFTTDRFGGFLGLISSSQPLTRITLTPGGNTEFAGVDNIAFGEVALTEEVTIDLKPGGSPNCVSARSGGRTPVAILGGGDVDIGQINPLTVELGGALALRCGVEDVAASAYQSGDGVDDLVCSFRTREVSWPVAGSDCGEVALTGELLDGTPFEGGDIACLAGEPTCEAAIP